jgi:tetratricopeptide (TPR) repeat protein
MLRRAAAEAGKEDRREVLEMQARLFTNLGQEAVKAREWEKAISLAERGLKKVDPEPAKRLRSWRNGVYLRWSDAEEKAGHFEKAVAVLEQAMTADPAERDFPNNLGCLVRDGAKKLHDAGKRAEAKQTLLQMQKRFARCKHVQEAGTEFVDLVLNEPLKRSQYGEALELLDHYAEVVENDKERERLAGRAYDAEARPLINKKEWAAAAVVYEKGLKRYPGNAHLKHNLAVCQERAKK